MQHCAENCSMLHAPLSSEDWRRRIVAKTRLDSTCLALSARSSSIQVGNYKHTVESSSSRPKLSQIQSCRKRRDRECVEGEARDGWGGRRTEGVVLFMAFCLSAHEKYTGNIVGNILELHFPLFLCLLAPSLLACVDQCRLQTGKKRFCWVGPLEGYYCIGIRNNITFQFVWPPVADSQLWFPSAASVVYPPLPLSLYFFIHLPLCALLFSFVAHIIRAI